jgi:flagellin-like hook-associated protein FlgL
MLGFTNTSDDKVQFAVSDEEVVNITIDASNNKIDFKELGKDNQGMVVGDLTASIRQKVYTSHSELAQEVEKALEAESLVKGNRVDYSVSWDSDTKKFAIKENGSSLEEFQLMWRSGENAPADQGGSGNSIGSILGFDSWDDIETPVESSREVEWGIFNTLIDLNGYLEADDTYGLERSLERIDTHFDNMTSRIADSGMKFNRLEVREKITTEVHFSMTERRSSIEDADFIESVMNLKAINTAYEASLSSTSKIMKLSLVDYL